MVTGRLMTWLGCGVIALALLMHLYWRGPHESVFPPCLLYRFTGWHCAGCGMTRALHAGMHGHFFDAFRFNPLMVLWIPLVILGAAVEIISIVGKRSLPFRMQLKPMHAVSICIVLVFYTILRNLPAWPFVLLAPP